MLQCFKICFALLLDQASEQGLEQTRDPAREKDKLVSEPGSTIFPIEGNAHCDLWFRKCLGSVSFIELRGHARFADGE